MSKQRASNWVYRLPEEKKKELLNNRNELEEQNESYNPLREPLFIASLIFRGLAVFGIVFILSYCILNTADHS